MIAGEALATVIEPGEALVVRPDQHIAARLLNPTPDEARAAIGRAFGGGTA